MILYLWAKAFKYSFFIGLEEIIFEVRLSGRKIIREKIILKENYLEESIDYEGKKKEVD